MNLAGKRFRAVSNSSNGSLNDETVMIFTDDDGLVVGSYGGGTIVAGHVIAQHKSISEMEMLYQGATADGRIQAGRAEATFETAENGELRMHLDWQWLTGDRSSGESDWVLLSDQ